MLFWLFELFIIQPHIGNFLNQCFCLKLFHFKFSQKTFFTPNKTLYLFSLQMELLFVTQYVFGFSTRKNKKLFFKEFVVFQDQAVLKLFYQKIHLPLRLRLLTFEKWFSSKLLLIARPQYQVLPNQNLEKVMATHSGTLAWKIPWMEEPGRLRSMGSLRVRHH